MHDRPQHRHTTRVGHRAGHALLAVALLLGLLAGAASTAPVSAQDGGAMPEATEATEATIPPGRTYAPKTSTSCSGSSVGTSTSAIFLYTPAVSARLNDALMANPATCASYFLSVKAYDNHPGEVPVGTPDPPSYDMTWPRAIYETAPDGTVKDRWGVAFHRLTCSSATNCTAVTPPAGFHAMAEFRPADWAKLQTCPSYAPNCNYACSFRYTTNTATQHPESTTCWYNRGVEFRRRMAQMGYTIAPCSSIADCQDTWAIQELSKVIRAPQDNSATSWSNEANYRAFIRAAARGLYEGPLVSGQHVNMLGAVYMSNFSQATTDMSRYPGSLRSWFTDTNFWNNTSTTASYLGMRQYTLAWLHETYTECDLSCVQGTAGPSRLAANATQVNNFTMHPARLATAPDAPSSAGGANLYFDGRYTPLMTAYYSGTATAHPPCDTVQACCVADSDCDTNNYGNNIQLDPAAMLKFVRLQAYAARSWSTNHSYPDRRIGFAYSTEHMTSQQAQQYATGLAEALRQGYSDGASAINICAGAEINCLPALSGASTNSRWGSSLFTSWP